MDYKATEERAKMLAKIETINRVDGFDPSPFAVDYVDLNTQETRKRLPVMIQMAWFRLKYPEGRIAVQVTAGKDCFIANARIYPNFRDPVDYYLAEATASRKYCEDKPSVSPREWAQTAAVGIALRNAGFGLQFSMAGEELETTAADELGIGYPRNENNTVTSPVGTEQEYEVEEPMVQEKELTYEERVMNAMQMPCPIKKFSGKTLGEVLPLDPGAIKWIAAKFLNDEEIRSAAQLICEYALEQATA